MPNEADTCRRYVVPKLQSAGWEEEPHRINEQVTFTDGRIVVVGRRGRRKEGKRADYILRYRPDFPIAVVEAKPTFRTPGEGMQQAKDYAEIIDGKRPHRSKDCVAPGRWRSFRAASAIRRGIVSKKIG